MRRKSKRIVKVEVNGPLRYEQVDVTRWAFTQHDFEQKRGIILPSERELMVFGSLRQLRMILERHVVTYVHADSSFTQFAFNPGYLTDLGSVPWFFRSFVDNDDVDMVDSFLPHDACFSTHWLSFSDTNRNLLESALLAPRRMAETDALPLGFRARVAFGAVASVFGKKRWKETVNRESWTLKTCEFLTSDQKRKHILPSDYLPNAKTALPRS